jgi:arylsulfatase A-like enzyme
LQAAGYHTAYFGKWHVERSNQLERFGFDVYEVKRYRQRKDLFVKSAPLELRGAVSHKGYDDFLLYGVTDRPVEEMSEYQLYRDSIGFLRRAALDPDRPWALFISTEAPHDPYLVPRAYYERYDPAAMPRPASFKDNLAHRPGIYRRIQQVWQAMAWPQFAQATACYYAFCSMVDDQIGRLLAVLDELEQLEQTLIIFTSDHGDYLGAHRLMLKGIPPFEEAYRVPLILTGPGVPKGRIVDNIVSHLDLAPTLTLLTVGSDFPSQGRSLLPLLGSGNAQWRDEAYAECHGQRFYYTQRVIWQDSWKYVFNGFDIDELYDLDSDPHELHNLAADPAYRVMLETLAGRMWQIARETGDSNLVNAQYGMFRFAPVGPVET